ncbi:MAG: substrate-binding domain-containing protein [Verrucomicrobiota bacterium JB024]|nr:substrate-binding domain-containing protein [Verrucomicrobiota bacterium JB024]
MRERVAIVMNEEFLRRLTAALAPFVRRQLDFKILSILRPQRELEKILREMQPVGLVTEWLPGTTEKLLALGIPTVLAVSDYTFPHAVSIDVDDWAVGAEAARAFKQAGLRSLACLGNGTPYSAQRIEGFCKEAGEQVPVHTEEDFRHSQYSEDFLRPGEELLTWLSALPKPVGIFAVHDPLGRFLCSACEQAGLKVPDEVAVIGANNDELVCGLSAPTLSSVAIPWERIGAQVGEAMVRLLAGEGAGTSILLPPGSVVMRHSADYLAVEDPDLRRAMSYFSRRIQEPLTIGGMCQELRMSRRTIERKFGEVYGCSPWEMLCRMRVSRARELLAQTRYPVSMIADLSGFNDPERMAVIFRRVTGRTPSSFRRAQRGS